MIEVQTTSLMTTMLMTTMMMMTMKLWWVSKRLRGSRSVWDHRLTIVTSLHPIIYIFDGANLDDDHVDDNDVNDVTSLHPIIYRCHLWRISLEITNIEVWFPPLSGSRWIQSFKHSNSKEFIFCGTGLNLTRVVSKIFLFNLSLKCVDKGILRFSFEEGLGFALTLDVIAKKCHFHILVIPFTFFPSYFLTLSLSLLRSCFEEGVRICIYIRCNYKLPSTLIKLIEQVQVMGLTWFNCSLLFCSCYIC